ncbi:MAG: hypothetical protein NZO58_08620, partial [Gemmataceae bacterium]|nr:hypothetical protein [Gemmataceae bacterium]
LLQVPNLRTKYLQYVRTIAEKDLDWRRLGPIVAGYRALIEKEIELDTRKLSSLAEFRAAVADSAGPDQAPPPFAKGGVSLKAFADGRRAYLLNHPEIRKLAAAAEQKGAGE